MAIRACGTGSGASIFDENLLIGWIPHIVIVHANCIQSHQDISQYHPIQTERREIFLEGETRGIWKKKRNYMLLTNFCYCIVFRLDNQERVCEPNFKNASY